MKLSVVFLCLVMASMIVPITAIAGTVQLPETGQTISYGTGDDGAKQAGVAWPNPRFTDKNDGTVTDNLTGLIWLKNPNCFNWQPWASALNSANTLASGACGLSDGSQAGQWRLPNVNELESLVDLSHFSPALPAGNPFTNVQSNAYWTSNTYATLVGGYVWAWGVDMTNGGASSGYNTDYFYVWPVRSGQVSISAPSAPTITQVATGNNNATVTFTAPTNNGGSAITGYTVTSIPPGGVDQNSGSTSLTHVITGLTNGTSYTFTVAATNSAGTSAASTLSDPAIPGSTPRIQLTQTGQTGCWDANGNPITCIGTGQDGGILSGVAWPDPRFTNPDGTTPVSSTIVVDQLTGLQWAKDASVPSYGSCNGGALAWPDALTYVACLNQNLYLGHGDWRLPNVSEMETLINQQTPDSSVWLNSFGFTNAQATYYWTSTTNDLTGKRNQAEAVNLTGNSISSSPKINQFLLIPVRTGQFNIIPKTGQIGCWDVNGNSITCSGTGQDGDKLAGVPWPNPRFTNLDLSTPISGSTIYDRLTGLQWVQDGSTPSSGACSGGLLSWQNSLNYISCLNANNYLGYNDWRLPNKNELLSLVYSQDESATWLISKGFLNMPQGMGESLYWSSDTSAASSIQAWYINYGINNSSQGNKTNTYLTLPVRGGVIVPGAPTITSVTTNNGSATVNFTPPAANGGTAISGYTVTTKVGSTIIAAQGGTSSPITVSGLTNGTTYTFFVAATNSSGTGKSTKATATVTAVLSTNGHCGSAAGETFTQTPTTNLCSSGSATAVNGTGPQQWYCNGSGGGANVSCISYLTTNVAAPITTIAPAGGSYTTGSVLVTLTCSNSAATIYYTTDGSIPTVNSPVYSSPTVTPTPITVTGNKTINYFSVDPAGNHEPVRTATYSVTTGGPPTVDVALEKSGTSYTVFSSIGGATPTPVVTNTPLVTLTDTTILPPNTIITYTATSDYDPSLTTLMTIHTPMYNGWNIISVPYSTTNVNPSAFFGSSVSAIYQWVPSGATPESSNSVLGSYMTVNNLVPGNGYFVKANNNSTMLVYAGNPGPSTATITLNPGWTMIANPQLTNMTNIGANWLIDGNPLSQAITANLIGGSVYWWNGTTYNSWTVIGNNPQIEPWKGYWIVNIDSKAHSLLIQLPPSVSSN